MNEKHPSGFECNECATKRLGYRGSQDHGHIERQGSVLTNQCLGERTIAERGDDSEASFLTDRDKLIVENREES